MSTNLRAVCVLLFSALLCGTAAAQWPMGQEKIKTPAESSLHINMASTGRFQTFFTPQAKKTTFMLDTNTGKVWIMKKDHLTGTYSFTRVQVEGVDAPKSSETDKTDKADQKKTDN